MTYTTKRHRPHRNVYSNPFENMFNEMMHIPMNRFVTQKDVKFSYPATNITEKEDSFVLELLIPGVDKDALNIDIEESLLVVSRKANENDKKNTATDKFKLREFNYQQFERKFTLPNTILIDSIKAKLSKGILEITIMKNPEIKQTIIVK